MDEFMINKSLSENAPKFDFENRNFIYVADSNGSQSYPSGQIRFDLSSIANSDSWNNWSESYVQIPIVANLHAITGTLTAGKNDHAMSLKTGIHNFIDSVSVTIDNKTVVEPINGSNIAVNYKLMTEMSQDDLHKHKDTLMYYPDNAESLSYAAGGVSAEAIGEYNNVIAEDAFDPDNSYGSDQTQNKGRLERMKMTNYNPANTKFAYFTSAANCQSKLKSYQVTSTTDVTQYIMANIPLKFLHSIFKEMPLIRGSYIQMNINCNTYNGVYNTAALAYTSISSITTPYHTCPMQLSPLGAGNGLELTEDTGNGKFSLNVGITKATNEAASISHSQTQCKMYVCQYRLNPSFQESYMRNRSRTVYFEKYMISTLKNVTVGAQFNHLVTSNIAKPRWLLVVPQLSDSVNGLTQAANGLQAVTGGLLSAKEGPWSSAPSTTMLGASVTNYQVKLSGRSHYPNAVNYGFENWLHEQQGVNAVNGAGALGITSGLLNQSMYEHGYSVLYTDLSRKTGEAEDKSPRSIEVSGQNNTLATVDYICIVGYEDEVQLDVFSGKRLV